MEILAPESLLLGKIIGVTMVIAGLSMVLKKAQWLKITKDIAEKPTILYIAALVEFIIGLTIVLIHPIWIPCWPTIITVLGWLMMVGSALYLLLPHKSITSFLKFFMKPSLIIAKGIVLILIGAYMSIMAFGEITFLEKEKVPADKDSAIEMITENSWIWTETVYTDAETFVPNQPEEFVLTFNEDGSMGSLTDCNNMGGGFEIDEEKNINFSEMFSTKMYCEGSQESDYMTMLQDSEKFTFENGNLILKSDKTGAKMIFLPKS